MPLTYGDLWDKFASVTMAVMEGWDDVDAMEIEVSSFPLRLAAASLAFYSRFRQAGHVRHGAA